MQKGGFSYSWLLLLRLLECLSFIMEFCHGISQENNERLTKSLNSFGHTERFAELLVVCSCGH